MPIIGDTMMPFGELDADQVSRLETHESWHRWANFRIGQSLYPKGESECKGKCWAKEAGGTYSQMECDSFVKAKAQAVISYVDDMMTEAGTHLHNIIGLDAIASPMPTFEQTYRYILDIRSFIDRRMSADTFCDDGF